MYPNCEVIRDIVRSIADDIVQNGIDYRIDPIVVGFTGYGNVSLGAQDIFDILPHIQVKPSELKQIVENWDRSHNKIIKVVFHENDTVRLKNSETLVDVQHFYDHPALYESVFHEYLPYMSILINGIFWKPTQPRIVTYNDLQHLYSQSNVPRLRVIGDISCDINGGIEVTTESTSPSDPVYVYDMDTKTISYGVQGKGPVIMAVDNLPCELSADASQFFGDALYPFVSKLSRTDFTKTFDQLDIPLSIRQAIIAHKGKLCPRYDYLNTALKKYTGEIA